jgi:hypothetical protein
VEAAIDDAQAHFINQEATWVQDLLLEGSTDNANQDYELPGDWQLIADDTLDETIDAADVHVHTEDPDTDPPTRTTQTVTSVNSRFGVIRLTSPPSSGVRVKLDGYLLKDAWDITQVKSAIKAYASWLLWGTVRDGSEVLTADPTRAEGDNGSEPAGIRHLRDYKRTVNALGGGSSMSAATRDKSIGNRRGFL